MYDNPFAVAGTEDSAAAVVLIIYMVMMIFSSLIGILSYILGSLGSYTIASRRGIKNAWLAWLPVGSSWILGCISDQYQEVARGRAKRKRVALVIMEIILYFLMIAMMVGLFSMLFQIGLNAGEITDEQVMGMMGSMGTFVLAYIAMFGIAIAYTIIYYFCLYDLYNSCKPDNSVLFLVLSILMSFLTPFLIFACRKKDLGMPERQPQYQPPVYGQNPVFSQQPATPTWHSVQNPQVQQPQYQPQQPAYPLYQPPVQPETPVYQPPVQPEPPVYQPPVEPVEPWEQQEQQ